MSWRDLLQKSQNETVVYPWCGGRYIQTINRGWSIKDKLPEEFGWYEFSTNTKTAKLSGPASAEPEKLVNQITGYLVGDKFIPDTITVKPNIGELSRNFETVNLIEEGIDKFVRVKCGRTYDSGQLIYIGQEFPLGPEQDVLDAFLEEKESIDNIPGVTPALDGAFKIEDWYRLEVRKRREEERKKRELEEKRKKIRESLGDGELRRAMALEDFGAAAKAALAVGGAVYLDHRKSPNKDEMVVRFRYLNRRFECTCNAKTLRIIDAGICLTSHGDDGFRYGTKGDSWFTLESLPPVISEAYGDGQLVVFRH